MARARSKERHQTSASQRRGGPPGVTPSVGFDGERHDELIPNNSAEL
jgi:hypothetical protein